MRSKAALQGSDPSSPLLQASQWPGTAHTKASEQREREAEAGQLEPNAFSLTRCRSASCGHSAPIHVASANRVRNAIVTPGFCGRKNRTHLRSQGGLRQQAKSGMQPCSFQIAQKHGARPRPYDDVLADGIAARARSPNRSRPAPDAQVRSNDRKKKGEARGGGGNAAEVTSCYCLIIRRRLGRAQREKCDAGAQTLPRRSTA